MNVLLQRVLNAKVSVENKTFGEIKQGILAFVGFHPEDTYHTLERMMRRTLQYRIFEDAEGRMNLNVQDVSGGILWVPQFTLAANTKKGTRPSFTSAMTPSLAEKFFTELVSLSHDSYAQTFSGAFGANMQVSLTNDGPVTFILES